MSARNCSRGALIQFAPRSQKFGDVVLQRSKIDMSGDVARIVKLGDKLADMPAVGLKVERKNFRVSQSQRYRAPNLRHQGMVLVSRVPEMVHPVEIVVQRVIDAVRAGKSKSDCGNPEKIQEYSMVRAASNASIRQLKIRQGLLVAQLRLTRNFPLVVQALTGRRSQRAAHVHEQWRKRAHCITLKAFTRGRLIHI